MSKTYNRITIVGRVGSDPEWFDVGKGLAKFSVATDRWKKDEGPDWHRVNCWGGKGELVRKYVTKGTLVLISGEMNYNRWETEEGKKIFSSEINCQDIQILGGGKAVEAEEPASDPDMPF